MKKMKACLLSVVVAAGFPASADALCDPFLGGMTASITSYRGNIGKYPVRLLLAFKRDDSIEGRYAYATSTTDILLRGKIEDGGTRISLTELDAAGAPTATFDATFADTDPAIMNGKAKLTCDVAIGQWRPLGSAKPPLDLRIQGAAYLIKAPPDHFYQSAGVKDDEAVNRNARNFRKAVVDGRREDAASHIRYPITIKLGGELVKFASAAELVARYDEVFLPRVRKEIEETVPRWMSARPEGVSFDSSGFIWLDLTGQVRSIYPH